MKKAGKWIVVLCLALVLTACGKKEQIVTYRSLTEQDALRITDTLVLKAEGDMIQNITETIEIDMSAFDEDTRNVMETVYDELAAQYGAIEGVNSSGEAVDGIYTLQMEIDATGDTLKELSEQGLLQVDESTDGISLEKTGESLLGNGYILVE